MKYSYNLSFQKSKKGFTLIELLVVVFIIGMLSTMSVISLTAVRAKARDTKRLSDIKDLSTGLAMYYSDHGYYPDCGIVACQGSTIWTNCFTNALTGIMTLPSDPKYDKDHNFRYCYDLNSLPLGDQVALTFKLEKENPNAESMGFVQKLSNYFQYQLLIPDY